MLVNKNKNCALSDLELGWLAGLLEGEGGFQFGGNTQTIRLEMSDEDIVVRAALLIKKMIGKEPTIRYQHRGNDKHSATYIISISGENARFVMKTIVGLMGKRRRQRIWQCLNRFKPITLTSTERADILKLVVTNG